VKAVLFDMDGVLVLSEASWFAAMNEIAQQLGFPPITREVFDRGWGQGVKADADEHYGGIAEEQLERLYAEAVPRHLHYLTVPRPTILDEVRALGLRVAVVTNTPQPLADQSLELAGLHAEVVCAAGEAAAKPAPDLIHLALRRLGLSTDEVVFVGDSASDTGATAAAGVRLIGLGQPGWKRIESLDELVPLLRQGE
jgi:HAD superfamily hydrolase (TIGR01509 family)